MGRRLPLPPHEIVLEDQRSVSAFLQARLGTALATPSRNHLHDLVLAMQVGHRRAQRALSLVFEGTEDARLKRSILERYAGLDRMLRELEEHHGNAAAPAMLGGGPSLVAAIDEGFDFARAHLAQVRDALPEVDPEGATRPSPPRDLEGTTTAVWFDDDFDDDTPTHKIHRMNNTQRGY